MLRFIALLLAIVAISTTIAISALPLIAVNNCTDPIGCRAASCARVVALPQQRCVPVTSAVGSMITKGKFIKVELDSQNPGLYSDTQVFEGDPTCSHPLSQYDIVCGTCQQFSPRLTTCGVDPVNGTFRVFVQGCSDANCQKCSGKGGDPGLPPGQCYAHPGVPGLFLKYSGLYSAAVLKFRGFEDSECKEQVSNTEYGVDRCFGGTRFSLV